MKMLSRLVSSILLSAYLFYVPLSSASPRYTIEPYPATCEAMDDLSAYDPTYLRDVGKIQKGQEGWLSTTKRDFPTNFGLANEQAEKEFDRLISYLSSYGTKLLLVYPPTRGMVYPQNTHASSINFDVKANRVRYANALDDLRQKGAVIPDLTQAFTRQDRPFLFFPKDEHWSQAGAIYFAGLVANEMAKHGFVGNVTKRFETSYSGIVVNDESIQDELEKLCQFDFPSLYTEIYSTSDVLDANSPASSKDDALQVVLLGSSYSSQTRFNFAGYIKQFSNLPVLDYSESSGGFTGAWINYLKSGEFEQRKPDLIIWEIPGWWQFEAKYFDAIIPYFHNGCNDGKVMMKVDAVKVDPKTGKKSALFSTEYTDIASKDLVLDIQFNQPVVESVNVRAWFASGLSKQFRLRQEPGTQNEGRFLANLGLDYNYTEEGVVALDIETLTYEKVVELPQQLTADLKVCKTRVPYVDK